MVLGDLPAPNLANTNYVNFSARRDVHVSTVLTGVHFKDKEVQASYFQNIKLLVFVDVYSRELASGKRYLNTRMISGGWGGVIGFFSSFAACLSLALLAPPPALGPSEHAPHCGVPVPKCLFLRGLPTGHSPMTPEQHLPFFKE